MVRNHDEFKDVADALDSMLDRLQGVLEEQSRFVANASHELRTPFAVMKSILDVAAVDVDGRDIDVLIQKLSNTNRRGVEIVEALLLLSSVDHFDNLERDSIDLVRIISDSLDDVRAEADNAGIKIHHELVGGDVTGNASLIRQLVTNLLINGVRHNLPTGGTLTISTSADTQGNIVLKVSSTGARIEESQLHFLTEPFVRGAGRVATSSEGRTGTGLGLAIVDQVVRAHNASLVLRAPDAGGLEVRVTFPPLAEAPTPTYAGHIRSR